MSHRTPALVGAALAACLALPAHAASPRVDTQVYLASGGAAAGPITAYATSSEGTAGGNVGQVRSTPRPGEKGVRITVTDGSGAPVAARIEVLHKRGMLVVVTCDASKQALRLRDASEIRVTPLAGVCTPTTGSPVASVPSTGEVVFAYRS